MPNVTRDSTSISLVLQDKPDYIASYAVTKQIKFQL